MIQKQPSQERERHEGNKENEKPWVVQKMSIPISLRPSCPVLMTIHLEPFRFASAEGEAATRETP